ncbi:MAG: hypothetical protein LBJ00_00440 [Planctomycetaceae bacterium]|nr:hypothetical protein [Planctomycetaceae bacterium]
MQKFSYNYFESSMEQEKILPYLFRLHAETYHPTGGSVRNLLFLILYP